jgi:hypothetical protein
MAWGEGFVICGTFARLVSPTLTMVEQANNGAHKTFCDDPMDIQERKISIIHIFQYSYLSCQASSHENMVLYVSYKLITLQD